MNSGLAALRAVLPSELSTAGRKMRTVFDRLVRARGLTLTRARTLMLLAHDSEMTQKDLAAALDVEHPTLVRVLDGLEKQGLIERCAVDGDRRAKRIALTPASEGQIRELEDLSEVVREQMLEGIPEEDVATALRVLRRIGENLDRVP
ncbi:MarR family winged helix-turn-helix transcriptional regulator [Segnochrobactraceae bacterium EtOH-i3]